jgi:hypothetical protein
MASQSFSVQSMSDYAKFAIIQQSIKPKFLLYTPDMKVKKVIHPWLPSAADYKKSDKLEFVSSKFSKCWSFLSCKITCLGSTLLHSISDDELFFKKGYTFHINSYFGKGKMSRV